MPGAPQRKAMRDLNNARAKVKPVAGKKKPTRRGLKASARRARGTGYGDNAT